MTTKHKKDHAPKKAESLIHVHNLTKTYWNGDVAIRAVRGVDLTINEGEFVALMGTIWIW